jgi:hypothetical protein
VQYVDDATTSHYHRMLLEHGSARLYWHNPARRNQEINYLQFWHILSIPCFQTQKSPDQRGFFILEIQIYGAI